MTSTPLFGGIGRALSHRQFFLLWWGHGTITTGRWMYKVAIGWLTWEMTQSTVWLGIVAFADTFPLVIMSIVAGVWADRVGYLFIMRVGQTVMVLAGILITVLAFTDVLEIISIVLVTLVIGTSEATTQPARISIVHQLVPKEDLAAAIAVNSATYNFARFLGPTIAGGLIIWVSIPFVIAFSAGTFAIFYGVLFFLNPPELKIERAKTTGMVRDLIDGFKYSFSHQGISFLLISLSVTALFIRPYIDLLPGVSAQIFDLGAEGLSILLAATGLGAMLGAIWLAQRGRTDGLTNIFTWSLLISAISILLFIISGNIWVGAVLIAIVGFFIVLGAITSQTLIQSAVDSGIRARVISITMVLAWGLPAVGALGMGWIAEFLGLPFTLALGGALTVLLWLWAHRTGKQLAPILEGSLDPEADSRRA